MTQTTASTLIRPATPGDAAAIVGLVKDLAVYENEPASIVRLTEADLLRDVFGAERRCQVLIAELAGKAVGFALFFHNYSTWEGRAGIYIEDLFVAGEARGSGLGRKLVAEIAAMATASGCGRVDLGVLHWNPARAFYHRLGFQHMKDWLPYRLEGEALTTLAAEK